VICISKEERFKKKLIKDGILKRRDKLSLIKLDFVAVDVYKNREKIGTADCDGSNYFFNEVKNGKAYNEKTKNKKRRYSKIRRNKHSSNRRLNTSLVIGDIIKK